MRSTTRDKLKPGDKFYYGSTPDRWPAYEVVGNKDKHIATGAVLIPYETARVMVLDGPNPADTVDRPSHYAQLSPEPITVIRGWAGPWAKLGADVVYLLGNCVKYIARAPLKGTPHDDLKKALRYLTWAVEATAPKAT